MDPLDIKCTECNAKPREKCATLISCTIRETPHFVRIEAARHLSLSEAKEEHRVEHP